MFSSHAPGSGNPEMPDTDFVLFIGSAFAFPEVTLRLVRIEFDGLDARRIDRLDLDTALSGEVPPRLVIVEDRLAEALAARHDEWRRRLGASPIALAYGDAAQARNLLMRQQERGQMPDLRFLPLNAPIASWISMLRLLLAGEFVLPCELVSPPQATGKPPASAPIADTALTPRELEVLDHVAQGHRNKVIADRLSLSEHTVKLHIHNIISKIGVDNRTAAANWYLAQARRGRALPSMP